MYHNIPHKLVLSNCIFLNLLYSDLQLLKLTISLDIIKHRTLNNYLCFFLLTAF